MLSIDCHSCGKVMDEAEDWCDVCNRPLCDNCAAEYRCQGCCRPVCKDDYEDGYCPECVKAEKTQKYNNLFAAKEKLEQEMARIAAENAKRMDEISGQIAEIYKQLADLQD